MSAKDPLPPCAARELGMIFQEPLTRLNPLMRISEHFEETIRQHEPELAKDEVRERALEVLRLMGIPPTRYKSYPHEFSGGMRQRLMIALALVLRPAFVVADEPTTALDVLVEAQIIQILQRPPQATSTPRCCSSPTTSASSPRRATGSR